MCHPFTSVSSLLSEQHSLEKQTSSEVKVVVVRCNFSLVTQCLTVTDISGIKQLKSTKIVLHLEKEELQAMVKYLYRLVIVITHEILLSEWLKLREALALLEVERSRISSLLNCIFFLLKILQAAG